MAERFGFDTDRGFDLRVWRRARLDGRRILYVDDDPSMRSAAVRMLRGAGGVCIAAGTHDQAIVLLSLETVLDLAILDFQMPDGDVRHLVRRLRLQQPSLQLLGTSGADCRAEFAARGIDDFMPKPWALDDLIRVADWSQAA